MKRKSHLLFAISAAALILDVTPAFAGAGAIAVAERGDRGGDRGNRGGGQDRGNGGQDRGGADRGGDRGGGDRGGGGGGGFRGGQGQGGQQQQQAQPQPQQQPQRQFGNGNGGQRNGWQTRMQGQGQPQQDAQRQTRPDWANGGQRGGDRGGWQDRMGQKPERPAQAQPQPQPPRQDFSNGGRGYGDRNGQANNQPNWRVDRNVGPNGPTGRNDYRNSGRNNGPAFSGYRREPNPTPRYDTRFGQRYDYRRDNWAGRNDWARYDRRNRSQITVNIGSFFGPSYGTITSRYYGRNYIYYSSHRWSSWNRPWRVGYVLPPTMFCEPLPYDLYFDLPPPPWGYDYALCDGDILMIGTDTGVIYDAILPY